jgi:hypothetical protein
MSLLESPAGEGQAQRTGRNHPEMAVGSLTRPLDPRRQCSWFGPTSSSRRDRNSLRIGDVLDLL